MTNQLWQIIVPEATINLVTNPSFETNGVGWYGSGANTIARSSAQSCRGGFSGLITYQNNASPLAYYSVTGLTSSGTYYVSAWVYVPANWDGGNISIAKTADLTGTLTANHIWTAGTNPTAQWTYLESKLVMGVDTAGGIGVGASGTPTAGRTIYLDAFQMEEKASYATTYCDGDQDGCVWSGTAHGSTSTRSAATRAGGRVVNLGDYGLTVRFNDGVGLPSSQHLTQTMANLPGASFKGRKVLPRVLTLTTVAPGTSAANLHSKRKDLLEAINPDGVPDDQPFILRYLGANSSKPLEIKATYDTGMGFEARFKVEEFPLRVIAYDPYFYELNNDRATLTTAGQTAITNSVYRADGGWASMEDDLNNTVRAIVQLPDLSIYAGGDFTAAGALTLNRFARWNEGAWSALGAAPTGTNGTVYTLAGTPGSAYVYLGGDFTSSGGVATNYVARYNVGLNTFSQLAGGTNALVRGMAVDQSGNVYIVGDFTGVGGIATVNRVCWWDGAAYHAMGAAPGVSGTARCVVVGPDGSVYIGGDFTTADGVTVNRVTKWNGTAFSALGAGMNNAVYALAMAPNGNLIAGGAFTTADGNTVNGIAEWNGKTWHALGSGVAGSAATVYALATLPNGHIAAVGDFTSVGGVAISGIALWNGSVWTDYDVVVTGLVALLGGYDGKLYAGGASDPTATSAPNTLTNSGSSRAYPKITIQRSGGTGATVKWLRNETTGKGLYLNYALQDGEILTIDAHPERRAATSNYWGDVSGRAIFRGSDLSSFYLLPGANNVTVYVSAAGGATVTGIATWRTPHISADGAAA